MIKLPEEFCQAIHQVLEEDGLGDSWEAFLASFNGRPSPALRLNRLKGDVNELWRKILHRFSLAATDWEKVRWTQESYYLPTGFLPAQTLAYLQGLFYLQEASATVPATVLAAKPGDYVLDLCAAPGGKSTKLLADMQDQGLLICNEINLDRARVLLRNLEQWGGTQVILTHADPNQLKTALPTFFDKILVDAPCSGEGMFLRDSRAIKSWESYSVASCAKLQENILDCAAAMLKPGGELVYSTCTFNRRENEEQIVRFLQQHPEYELLPAQNRLPEGAQGVQGGIAGINGFPTENTLRIWPHQARGEGHFCALLRKRLSSASLLSEEDLFGKQANLSRQHAKQRGKAKKNAPDALVSLTDAFVAFEDFAKQNLTVQGFTKWFIQIQSRLYLERNYLHLAPETNPALDGVHLLKRGLLLGEIKPGKKIKFNPAHAWSLAALSDDFQYCLHLSEDDPRVYEYIAGQTIALDDEISAVAATKTVYVLLVVEGFAVGFLQSQPNGQAKNLYPQSWIRRLRSPWEERS